MLDINDLEFIKIVTMGIPLDDLEMRLRPGESSTEGFLGKDEKLLEVVHADWQVVERFGLTHQIIAQSLVKAIKRDKEELPNPQYQFYNGGFTCGYQSCPWCGVGRGTSILLIHRKEEDNALVSAAHSRAMGMKREFYEKCKIGHLYGVNTGDKVAVFSELHTHLIDKHYFFEGRESPWRADPELLIRALGLAKKN
jgi:hypothetical protein